MDKIKFSGRYSLRKSLILYVTIFAALAVGISVLTASVCNATGDRIRESYPTSNFERYYLTNENGEQLGEGVYISKEAQILPEKTEHLLDILEFLPIIATPIYSALCIIAAALLFYRNKLKRPLAELKAASERISGNNLDFSIEYDSKDELGQLCTSFEIMRDTLRKNFSEMWRKVEERKHLNAAFAHDLRTPLTVLKGYNEILQLSGDMQIRETATTMEKHISRMEAYVASMSSLQSLEDVQPEYKMISPQTFLTSISESAEMICSRKEKAFYLQNRITATQLSVDTEMISQVCNNLIENAVRYAKTSVTLSFDFKDGGLLLSVSDDGKGFDNRSLQKALNPYFTEEIDHSEHFGIGLYICKLLCEHHGGYLKIENIPNGARVSALFKSAVL